MSNENRKVIMRTEGLKQYFPTGKKHKDTHEKLYVRANDGIDLEIYEGETVGLVGESGCGKSTYGRTLLKLYNATAGEIYFRSDEIYDYKMDLYKKMYNKYIKKLGLEGQLQPLDIEREYKFEEFNRLYLELLSRIDTLSSEVKTKKSTIKIISDINIFIKEINEGGLYNITETKGEVLRKMRKEMQFIFQDPYSSLNPRMTVGNIIGEALVEHEMFDKGSQELEDYVKKIMNTCGLDDYMIYRYPHEFSGGQRQRIGIARSLALNPKFIVCDEAVSALDVSIQSQVINLLNDLQAEFGMAYLFISHDLSVIKHISDRIGVMYLGNMVEFSDKKDLFENPQHPYTKALLSAIPITDLEAARAKKRIILEGDIPSNVIPPPGCKFHTRCPIAKDICKQEVPVFEEVEKGHFVACHFKGSEL